jgi:CheY-like chemotaxis protein
VRGATSKVEIQTESEPNLFANVDRLRLEQIILNLALNATKFVDSGFIRFRAGVINGKVCLFVEDSGSGIPPEKRGRLFEKYEESFDVLNQGTGIGLYICKNLSNLMGANIWLDETYDSGVPGCPGARFVIDLNQPPICMDLLERQKKYEETPEIAEMVDPDTESTESTHVDLENGVVSTSEEVTCTLCHGSSTTLNSFLSVERDAELPECLSVLFVDDDATLRKLFMRSLRRVAPKWKVDQAPNAETALEMVACNTYNIIFIDQYMASNEKQLLGTESVPLLREKAGVACLICGLSANDMEKQFIEAGANSFILKPFPCAKDALQIEILRVLRVGKIRTA